MNPELQAKADELIRTLGALGLAQERLPHSPEEATLTAKTEQLTNSFDCAFSES